MMEFGTRVTEFGTRTMGFGSPCVGEKVILDETLAAFRQGLASSNSERSRKRFRRGWRAGYRPPGRGPGGGDALLVVALPLAPAVRLLANPTVFLDWAAFFQVQPVIVFGIHTLQEPFLTC